MIRKLLLSIVIPGALLCGCSEDKLDTYGGIDSVYWGIEHILPGTQNTLEFSDSTYYSFISRPSRQDTILPLKVQLLGNIVPYNRYFRAVIVADKTTAPDVNFELEGIRFMIPADSIAGIVPLRLKYSNDLLEKSYRVCLQLLPGDDLDVNIQNKVINKDKEQYIDFLKHTVIFDCQLKKPARWDEKGELGYFTSLKYLEMTKYFTLDEQVWNSIMPGMVTNMAVYMASKLKKAYDSDPVTLKNSPKEIDGKLMWFPLNKGAMRDELLYDPKKK